MTMSPEDAKRRRLRMERLPRVTDRYLRGWSVRQIAAAEEVTPRVIYKDIEVAHRIWGKDSERNVKLILAKELAKLDRIEREMWERHEASLNDAVERRTQTTDTEKGTFTSKSKMRRGQNGDPRWMTIVLQCMDRRRILLRLDSEEKHEAGRLQTKIVEVVVDSPEQVAKIISYEEYDDLTGSAEE